LSVVTIKTLTGRKQFAYYQNANLFAAMVWGMTAMAKRFLRYQPKSLAEAFQACIDHALVKHNRSVEQIADLMSVVQAWRLYKWVAEANMPTCHIRGFEHACGANFVTRYLAHSAHQLLIDIPTGRNVEASDIQGLQAITTAAIGALIEFAAHRAEPDEVVAAITKAMEGFAYHRTNITKHQQPELALEDANYGH
jgi:hypothetical protein